MMKFPSLRRLLDTFWDAFLPQNAVLVQALGLCPILAIGYSLKEGIAFSLCILLVMVPANLLLSLVGKRIPQWLRPPIYAVLTMGLLLLASLLMRPYLSANALYVFLPLMAVNSLFTVRASGKQAAAVHPLASLAESLGVALGFALVMCVACAIREAASSGTVWGNSLGYGMRFVEAKYAFIGYVLLGFMAAGLQSLRRIYHRLRTKKGDESV